MDDKIINGIKNLIKNEKMNRKQIYENLLAKGVVKPNSERIVYELLEYCIENGLINPGRIIRFKKKRGRLPEILTIEELIKIFDNVDRPKLAVAMWLGLFCGLRISEACNLRIDDIDLNNKKIFVRNSKNTNRSKQGYGKDRIVMIPDIAIDPIKKWLEIIQGGKWLMPSMQNPDKQIRTKTIHEQYRELLNRCQLSEKQTVTEYRAKNHGVRKNLNKSVYKYRFHTLRHTYASYLLEKGVPIENIQKLLGHEDYNTTLIYAKVSDNRTGEFVNQAFEMPMKLVKNDSVLMNNAVNEKVSQTAINLSPEDILKQRLASGELDLLTYKRILTELNPENTVNIIHTV